MNRRMLVVATVVAASACRISAPADPNGGLGPVATVLAPVIEEEIGQLFAEAEGLWAFRTPDPARADTYEVGAVVVFGDLGERDRHLFAVTQKHSWGVRLQRLDADPIANRASGTLIPLTQLDAATGDRWGFCAGEGDLRTAECLDEGPLGTRWRIYELSGGKVLPTPSKEDSGTLPIVLRGQVAVHPFGRDVMAFDPPLSWFAVPTATPEARPTRPRIVVDDGCDVGSPHRDALDAQWIVADIEPPDDVLQTTSEAVRHGADALVWCERDKAFVGVPTLYRPRIAVSGRDFGLPPMFGVRPIEIGANARPATDFIARLGAAHATGDFATADYLAERIAREFTAKRPLDRVLVDSMSAIADGGRPEAAARMGLWATRLQWNPKTSAAWQVGMASIEAALGNRQAAIKRTSDLTEVLNNLGDDDRKNWVAYFWAVSQIAARGAISDYTEAFADNKPLVLAARAEAARVSGKPLEELRAEFVAAGAEHAWGALAGIASAPKLGCDADDCAADVYGLSWHAKLVDAEALSRVPRVHLRPGYVVDGPADTKLESLQRLVALYPLVEDDDAGEVLQLATDNAVAWVRATCNGSSAVDQLGTLRNLGLDADLRTPSPRPMDATMVWLATRGVKAACSDTKTLATASIELAGEVGVATVPADLLALHVEKAAAGELLSVLETATSFAVEHEHGDRCASWTVALASAYADAGEFDRAQNWIQSAARCDVTERESIDLVSAYLNFQRTSTTSADFAETTRDALRAVAHVDVPTDTCVGVRELDYELIGALPESERTLASRLKIPPAKQAEDVSLITANDRLGIAREHLGDVLTAMDARDFVKAAASLGHARSAFEGVSHEIGIARVRFLDKLLFEGNAATIATGEAEFARVGFAPLRKKGTLSELAASNSDVKLAVALLRDDVTAAAPLARNQQALCEASPRRVRNVLIDRVDGELKNTRPQDDGPEIELVEP